jgi:hypothetical protein
MNALQALQMTAGQRVHEQLYEATLDIFDENIPCTHTEIVTDFELEAGKSVRTFIMALTFRLDVVFPAVPEKGVRCTLHIKKEVTPLKLQLWDGGLMPGGFIYIFRAVDEDYRA